MYKILYIITQAEGGGAQNYVLDLARAFGGSIAAGTEAQGLFTQAQQNNIPTVPLQYLKREINPIVDCFALWEIFNLVKQTRPDIVHVNSSKAGFIGSIAAKLAGAKVVYTAHGFVFNEPGSWLKQFFYVLMEKIASYFRDYIIAVSEADHKSALEKNIIAESKISTIHNGIPPLSFLSRAEARNSLGISGNGIYIGTIANLYTTKGLDILLHAVKEIKSMFLDVKVFIIGEGPKRGALETQIRALGLSEIAELAGNVPGAAKYLKALDIYVLPSRKEGFPYAILEAMQAGLPIVASSVGGVPEALGEAGLLVPPENPSALAGQLTALILEYKMAGESNKLSKLGREAETQAKKFSLEAMLNQTEAVYRQLVNLKS